MSDTELELFQAYPDLGPASVLKTQLDAGGVPAVVEAYALESGRTANYCVFVPKALAHRARWIVAQLQPSVAELEFLATGKLPGTE